MFTQQTIIRDLGNGLVMRRATREDADALSEFNANIHGEDDDAERKGVEAWTRDLLTRPHATFRPGDFTIVEEISDRTNRLITVLDTSNMEL